MNNSIDLQAEKQKLLDIFDKLELEQNNYQATIKQIETENHRLKAQTSDDVNNPPSDKQLQQEINHLKHTNQELENLLNVTKSRISELSAVLIEKETLIKELKANQPKRSSRFDISESDQLFEAKMAVTEKDKIIRQLESKLARLDNQQIDTNNEQLIEDQAYQIEVLQKSVDKLEQANVDLIFENQELKSQVTAPADDQQIVDTTELREIDSLLDEITDQQLTVEYVDPEQLITELAEEFELTDKAILTIKLLANNGLYRDSFKKQLMSHHEMIDSFIGEVNGQFEDDNYIQLITEDKHHYRLNSELFE